MVLFLLKNADFLSKDADINKIKKALELKGIFSETTYVCALTYQISSLIILTSFRKGVCVYVGGGRGS